MPATREIILHVLRKNCNTLDRITADISGKSIQTCIEAAVKKITSKTFKIVKHATDTPIAAMLLNYSYELF